MKKRISTSNFHCVVGYILLLITVYLVIVELLMFLFVIFPDGSVSFDEFFVIGGINVISLLIVFLFNRTNCWFWVEDGYIKRKGFWLGFEKVIRINDIRRVETSYFGRGGEYLNLITEEEGSVNRASKNSYISFLNNRKNREFLSTFWNGPIDSDYSWKSKL